MHKNFSTISVCCLKKCAQPIDCKPPSLSWNHFKQWHKSHSYTCRGWDSGEPNKGGYYLNHWIFRKKEICRVLRSLMLSVGSPLQHHHFSVCFHAHTNVPCLDLSQKGKSSSILVASFAEVIKRVFLCCSRCRLPGVAATCLMKALQDAS